MNLTNYKTAIDTIMRIEIDAWKAGERDFTVSNQFDLYILESAVENFDLMGEDQWQWFADAEYGLPGSGSERGIMNLANNLSTFEVEPLADGWVN